MVFFTFVNPPWSLLAKFLVVDDTPEPVDVLITLGGDPDRELYAAELYMQGLAPKIIMTGYGQSARQMAGRAIKAGVDEKDIMIENKSESTYDNALYSRDIVLKNNFKSAIVVSSPYHMRRSKLVFNRVFRHSGVKLIYCSSKKSDFNPDGQCRSKIDRHKVKREYLKLTYYWLRYW
jgi:hypothetical protein